MAVLDKPDIVDGCDGSSWTDGAAEDSRGRSQVSHKTCCIVFTVVQYKHCHVDSDELKRGISEREKLHNQFKQYKQFPSNFDANCANLSLFVGLEEVTGILTCVDRPEWE